MRKIKLLKDHEDETGTLHKAGETVEVSLRVYNYLTEVYVNERKLMVMNLARVPKVLGIDE